MKKFNKDRSKDDGKKPYRRATGGDSARSSEKKESYGKRNFKDRPSSKDGNFGENKFKRKDKPDRSLDKGKRPAAKGGKRFSDKAESSGKKSFSGSDKRPSFKRSEDRPAEKRAFKPSFKSRNENEEEKSYKQKRSFTRNKAIRSKTERTFGEKKEGHFRGAFEKKKSFGSKEGRFHKEHGDREEKKFRSEERKPFKSKSSEDAPVFEKRFKHDVFEDGKAFSEPSYNAKKAEKKSRNNTIEGLTRLNKYLSNAGIASRRDADVLIKSGVVKVNGVPVTEMGYKVKAGDVVTYGDENVKGERKMYLLLNKPKDYITTMDDPQERKTVMDLIEGACKERIYPVGRLDRNTTGLLLFTNDGELTKKLTHPKHAVKKVYHVSLNKGLKTEDFREIMEGVTLEDGIIKADDLAYIGEGKKEVGIEIHSGKNRVVRRIFEKLGYEVEKLDRVIFAGLTKKDLPRGKHRFLTAKEIAFLQMIG